MLAGLGALKTTFKMCTLKLSSASESIKSFSLSLLNNRTKSETGIRTYPFPSR